MNCEYFIANSLVNNLIRGLFMCTKGCVIVICTIGQYIFNDVIEMKV